MKKIFFLLSLIICCASFNQLKAQHSMWIYNTDGTIIEKSTSEVDKITFSQGMNNMLLFKDNASTTIDITKINYITFSSLNMNDENGIYINFNNNTAIVTTSIDDENLSIEVDGADVVISTKMEKENITYYVYGSSTDGSLTIKTDKDFNMILNGLQLTSQQGVPIKISTNIKKTYFACNLTIANGSYNVVSDTENNKKKPVITSDGAIYMNGNGTLVVNSNKKNGISPDGDFSLEDATLIVTINGNAGKGIKCDGNITINSGIITCYPNGNIAFEDSVAYQTTSTNTLYGYDPSYCAGISAKGNIDINGGNITMTIPSTALAARGIKADGDITITTGTITITNNAEGGTYIDTTGATDSYKAYCIKADGAINLIGGTFNLKATGAAGRCVTADGNIIFGQDGDDNNNLNFTAATTGEKITVEEGYGWMNEGDYSNPKAVKAKGNLYVYSGLINITTENDGGEGLESKDTLFINGGEIVIVAYDDAINASNLVQINGGKTYAQGTNNDGIDSNGKLEVTGGLTIAVGSKSPEEGFDCDQNEFKITGGILIGIGGSTSTPTSSVCTQNSLIYKSLTNSTALRIEDAQGNEIVTFQVPTISNQQGQGGNPGGWWKSGTTTKGPGGGPGGPGGQGGSGLTLLFSAPELINGTYTIKQGGTITGNNDWHGYYDNATYTGGTSKSITISQKVTTAQ